MGPGVKCRDAFPEVSGTFEAFAQVSGTPDSELRHLTHWAADLRKRGSAVDPSPCRS